MKPSSLRPPQQALAGALQEERGDLFFTTSVENRESPLYIGHYPGTRTGAPIREARGCPLRAWEREGRSPHHPYLLLLLLLTNLPLDCVAPTGRYVGDLQIDRLVYELYGLTDEEITIVEEGSQTP
jgi:hypothetical protein